MTNKVDETKSEYEEIFNHGSNSLHYIHELRRFHSIVDLKDREIERLRLETTLITQYVNNCRIIVSLILFSILKLQFSPIANSKFFFSFIFIEIKSIICSWKTTGKS